MLRPAPGAAATSTSSCTILKRSMLHCRESDSETSEFEENISNDQNLRDLEERDGGALMRWSDYETMSVEVEQPRTTTTR